jgi:hypothetical protein
VVEALGSHTFDFPLQSGEPSWDQIGDLREKSLCSRKQPQRPSRMHPGNLRIREMAVLKGAPVYGDILYIRNGCLAHLGAKMRELKQRDFLEPERSVTRSIVLNKINGQTEK